MDDHLWIFLDNRGLSRPIEELWNPSLGIDVVWMTSPVPEVEINLSTDATPCLELSPADIAALSAEMNDTSGRVLAIFESIAELDEAANFGLKPRPVTIVSLGTPDAIRVAPNVFFTPDDQRILTGLIRRGFELKIQPLPNVTPRPWTSGALTAPIA